MKLRFAHNGIRVRVRKSDLQTLEADGSITETVQLGPQLQFSFSLKLSEGIDVLQVDMAGQDLILHLPAAEANAWINSQQVGIDVHQNITEQDQLHILIEKDFPCQDRANENKSDTFFELAPDTPEAC